MGYIALICFIETTSIRYMYLHAYGNDTETWPETKTFPADSMTAYASCQLNNSPQIV